jgi:uncharacterized protein YqeY
LSILDQLNQDLKQAMKDKDSLKLSVIRMLKTALKNEEINQAKTLTEDQELTILTRELKQRQDSLQEFEKAGRSDLAEKTRLEIDIVKSYLPKELSVDELRELIREAVAEAGATSKKEMGKVMSILIPKVKGRADGKLVNQLVSELLS